MPTAHQRLSKTSRYRLIKTCTLATAAISMVSVAFKIIALGFDYPPYPTLGVLVFSLTNYIFLYKTRNMDAAAWFVIIIWLAGFLVSAGYNSGGFTGPVLASAPLIPVLAVLLINARAGVYVLVLTLAVLAMMLYLQLAGLIPENKNDLTGLFLGRFISVALTGFVCTGVVWKFSKHAGDLLEEKQQQADTDFQTGLANRRAVDTTLNKEVHRCRRNKTWLSVILIDVDKFKLFNDLNGHQAGDDCLVSVADVLKSSVSRTADITGRFGGEEFIVILPETDAGGAWTIAEGIRTNMLAKNIAYQAGSADVLSLTLGIVTVRGGSKIEAVDLIKSADGALYRGKKQGRNRSIPTVIEVNDLAA